MLNLFCSALALLFSASAFVALLTIYLKANMTIVYINLVDVEVDLDGREDVALDAEVHNSCSHAYGWDVQNMYLSTYFVYVRVCVHVYVRVRAHVHVLVYVMDMDIDTDLASDVAHVLVHKAAAL